jgi:16S rRNA (uracil1498-N3)-methyltransferase
MVARFYCPLPLATGQSLTLPSAAARHVQVLRLQPGDAVTLFNGGLAGGEFQATVQRMTRSDVDVLVGPHRARECEALLPVHLAVGMPANERMDWLVEKATELGVASIQPLLTARTVLRVTGERAAKKQQHWQAIAVAACEQCGRNRVPEVHPIQDLASWLTGLESAGPGARYVLSLSEGAVALQQWAPERAAPLAFCRVLVGPEGGLDATEERAALAAGWQAASLGPRVLRAETAALAALAAFTWDA